MSEREVVDRLRCALIDDGVIDDPDKAREFAETWGPALIQALERDQPDDLAD